MNKVPVRQHTRRRRIATGFRKGLRARQRGEDKLKDDVYHGTLQELLVDNDALEALRYWDELDEVDTESGKFTVRYIFQTQLSQIRARGPSR